MDRGGAKQGACSLRTARCRSRSWRSAGFDCLEYYSGSVGDRHHALQELRYEVLGELDRQWTQVAVVLASPSCSSVCFPVRQLGWTVVGQPAVDDCDKIVGCKFGARF